jgi:hypothetical protein
MYCRHGPVARVESDSDAILNFENQTIYRILVDVGWRLCPAVRGRLHICVGEGSWPYGPHFSA